MFSQIIWIIVFKKKTRFILKSILIQIIDSDGDKKESISPFDEIDLQENEDDEDYEEDLDEEEESENQKSDGILDNNDYFTDAQGLAIDNEYVAEKLSAIYCLVEISKYQNAELLEFYGDLFNEIKSLTNFLHLDVRKESFIAISYLVSFYHDYCVSNLNTESSVKPSLTSIYIFYWN